MQIVVAGNLVSLLTEVHVYDNLYGECRVTRIALQFELQAWLIKIRVVCMAHC